MRSRRLLLIIFPLICFLFFGCASTGSLIVEVKSDMGNVRENININVIEAGSDQPVFSGVTDSTGRLVIPDEKLFKDKREYRLEINRDPSLSKYSKMETAIKYDRTKYHVNREPFTVQLKRNPTIISGSVYDDKTDKPIFFARIFVYTKSGHEVRLISKKNRTDKNGQFSLIIDDNEIGNEPVTVLVRHSNYEPNSKRNYIRLKMYQENKIGEIYLGARNIISDDIDY